MRITADYLDIDGNSPSLLMSAEGLQVVQTRPDRPLPLAVHEALHSVHGVLQEDQAPVQQKHNHA